VSFETTFLDFKVNGETSPSFNADGGGFTVNLPYKTERAALEGITMDPDTVVEIFSGREDTGTALARGVHTAETTPELAVGNNYFYIKVTAPSSSVQGYAVTVYRGKNPTRR
jgi:hypothetical protein